MAKFTKIFHDGEIDYILNFRGQEFTFIYGKWQDGIRKGRTKDLEYQVELAFKDDEDIEGILEYVNNLSIDDEDIEEALDMLEGWE